MKDNFDYKADLRERLQELKQIDGFPIGGIEDILALSNPPYYTACPNPYIKEFIEKYGSPYDEDTDDYHRKPYTDDINTNKNDRLTNAHSYHTKSPFHAIEQYIEHYSEPGDVVLDCFSGSGMTGIAAQKTGRKAILFDLSPIATYLSSNYNNSVSEDRYLQTAGDILEELEKELGWLYKTKHSDGKNGTINSIIFSECFYCPHCGNENVLWDVAVNHTSKKMDDPFICPNCDASIKKNECEKVFHDVFDKSLNKSFSQSKTVPVEIVYTHNKKRHKKRPDEEDIELISKINAIDIPFWHPTDEIPEGYNLSQPKRAQGYLHMHHLFTRRNIYALSALHNKISHVTDELVRDKLKITFNSLLLRASRKAILAIGYYFNGGGGYIATISGNWYIPSLNVEVPIFEQFKNRVKKINEINRHNFTKKEVLISTQSSTDLSQVPSDSIDFIFVDPPFGSNLMYSELNILYEAWNKVKTNNKPEAIVNSNQNKELADYNSLMLNSFKELFRVLKPNRWITIEYHNSSSSIWNGLQESLNRAGFVIAHTSVLKNKGGSFIINVSANSVSNDLIISAYKPSKGFIQKALSSGGVNMELDFINEHLSKLPVLPSPDRCEKLLYTKYIGFYLRNGYTISLNANEFYSLLRTNFIEEDGYWFTSNQINSYLEYKKKMKLEGIDEIKEGSLMIFITDEKSALVWLHNFLNEPKPFSDIYTAFTQLANIQRDEIPDFKELLEQNFIAEDGLYRRPRTESEHNSLNEKREKLLMRQFESLLIEAKTEKKKIKSIRNESVLLGFENCYKGKRYQDILDLSIRFDKKILEENAELAEFVEAAEIMVSGLS